VGDPATYTGLGVGAPVGPGVGAPGVYVGPDVGILEISLGDAVGDGSFVVLGNSVGTGVGSPAKKVGDTVGKPVGRALTGAAVKGGAVNLDGTFDKLGEKVG